MSNKFESFTYTQEYKNERYANLKVGDEVYLNIAHFWADVKEYSKYCKFIVDTYIDTDTDCCYDTFSLYNEKDNCVCSSDILSPACLCKIIEITETDIVLRCFGDESCNFKLTKEELFIAATKYDGWEWEITF